MVRSNSVENEPTQRTTSGGHSPLSAYVNSMNDGSRRRGSSFSVSAWEVLGAVSTFRHNLDRLRWYKSSISTIKFLSILNITYTVVGIVFLMLSIMPAFDMKFTELQRDNFFILGNVKIIVSKSLELKTRFCKQDCCQFHYSNCVLFQESPYPSSHQLP